MGFPVNQILKSDLTVIVAFSYHCSFEGSFETIFPTRHITSGWIAEGCKARHPLLLEKGHFFYFFEFFFTILSDYIASSSSVTSLCLSLLSLSCFVHGKSLFISFLVFVLLNRSLYLYAEQ